MALDTLAGEDFLISKSFESHIVALFSLAHTDRRIHLVFWSPGNDMGMKESAHEDCG